MYIGQKAVCKPKTFLQSGLSWLNSKHREASCESASSQERCSLGSKKMFPCKNCTERMLGCHSSCKRYHEAQEIFDVIREARKRENDAHDYVISFIIKEKKKKRDRHSGQF